MSAHKKVGSVLCGQISVQILISELQIKIHVYILTWSTLGLNIIFENNILILQYMLSLRLVFWLECFEQNSNEEI